MHCVSSIPLRDTCLRHGIPATSPERTLIDLGSVLTHSRLEAALVEALRKQLTDSRRLEERALDLAAPGRPGSGAVLRIIDRWGGTRLESVLEAKVLRLIRRHGFLPEPTRQVEVREGGRPVARVDFAYPRERIAIEADGYRWHSDPAAWQRDLARRNALTRAGWLVLHFTWEDVERRPKLVATTIARALSRRNVPGIGTKRHESG